MYSRYSDSPLISDGTRVINGLRDVVDISPRTDDMFYTVTGRERLDTIAYKLYGKSDLWWILADFNFILLPLCVEPGDVLRYPSYSRVFSEILV